MFAKTLAFACLASIASAHIKMSNPVPYGKSSLDNSPLKADGSDFPCKLRGNTYDAEGASNVYPQGSKQQLSFIGSAVHGGGSCQVSITTDLEPTKKSVWRVIKSIEGGCPAKGVSGNMGEKADAEDPFKYDYTIPKELAAGNYTLAWTWFNNVGNREMYMNCAPLTVTGSGGSQSHLDDLPDMFMANIGNGCSTDEMNSKNLMFPNPGQDVDRFNDPNDLKAITTGCPSLDGKQPAQTGVIATTPAGVGATTPASSPTVSPAPGNGNNGGNGGNGGGKPISGGAFITVSEPAPSQPATTQPVATKPATTLIPIVSTPVVSQAPVVSSAAPQPSSGSGSGSGTGSGSGSSNGEFAAGTACTTEGEWNCIGGSSFQRCASGTWSAPQGLSQGVTCTPGKSTNINMGAKRGMQMMRRSSRVRM